jgi:dipeptidyl-peptidase-4
VDPTWIAPVQRSRYAREGDLYTVSLDGGEPRRLTTTPTTDSLNGIADFIHQEELDQDRGFWWSDDGRQIAFVRVDARHIPGFPIVHQGKEKWEAEHHRYPFAGDPNAKLALGVVSLEDGIVRWMDLGGDEDIYLPRTWWTPDGRLMAEILSRDQKRLQLVTFDVESGACRVLIDEQREPWINLNHDTRFLKSGEILRASEATGFNHLYLHDREGRELRQLTSGEWVVAGVVSVDEEHRCAYFSGTRESVLERHLYRVSLDGGEIERLTEEPGWHGAAVSQDGEWYVDVLSTLRHAPTVTLRRTDGSSSTVLFDNAGNSPEELGLEPPEFVHMSADDGTPCLARSTGRVASTARRSTRWSSRSTAGRMRSGWWTSGPVPLTCGPSGSRGRGTSCSSWTTAARPAGASPSRRISTSASGRSRWRTRRPACATSPRTTRRTSSGWACTGGATAAT